jgi:hypothetical protein
MPQEKSHHEKVCGIEKKNPDHIVWQTEKYEKETFPPLKPN